MVTSFVFIHVVVNTDAVGILAPKFENVISEDDVAVEGDITEEFVDITAEEEEEGMIDMFGGNIALIGGAFPGAELDALTVAETEQLAEFELPAQVKLIFVIGLFSALTRPLLALLSSSSILAAILRNDI